MADPLDAVNQLMLDPVTSDSDPNRLVGEHIEQRARAGAGSPVTDDEWKGEIVPFLKERAPQADPDALRPFYERQRNLETSRAKFKGAEETAWGLLQRKGIPFASNVRRIRLNQIYADATQKFQNGTATEGDLDNIAAIERTHEIDSNLDTGGHLKRAGLGITEIVGEAAMAGRAMKGLAKAPGLGWLAPEAAAAGKGAVTLRAAAAAAPGYLGRTAAQTALTPSLYTDEAQRRAAEGGGELTDPKNLAPALALGTMQTAVFNALGNAAPGLQGGGVKDYLKTLGARTAIGLDAQEGLDALTHAAGLSTSYGQVGDALAGREGKPMQRLAVSAATFAAFGALHGREKEQLMAPVQEALGKMKARGLSADGAANAIAPVYETLNDALNENPNLSPAEARKLADAIPDKVAQKLGRDLADQLPEPKNGTSPISAPAESPKAPDQPGPQPSEETAGLPPDQFEAEVQRLMRGGRSRAAAKETLAEKAADAGMPEEEMQAEIDRMMGKKPRPAETAPPEPEPPKEAEPFEDLSADQLRQLSKQVAGRTLRTAAGLRKALREQGLSEKTMSDLSAATAKPAVPEKAPGVPQEAPASQTAPEPAQTPPEQPQATPEDVHPAAEAFRQTFPGMELTPSGQLRATVGEGESARHVYLSDGESSPHAVRLDFSWADSERVGKGKKLQPGSVDLMRGVGQLLGRLKEAGSDVEYTAVGGREAVYKRMLERQGFEQVSGPVGEGNGLRVWRAKEATGAVEAVPDVSRPQGEFPQEEAFTAAGLTEPEKHVVVQVLAGRSHEDIAGDEQLKKADGGRLTRQRTHQIWKDAAAKLGTTNEVVEAIQAEERADRGIELMEKRHGVTKADLGTDPEVVSPKAKRRLTARERVEDDLKNLADQMMKEAKRGRIGPERERYYRDEAERIYRRAEAPERGEGEEPSGESGFAGEPDRPAPVRRAGASGVPEAPVTPEAGPADQGGQPGAPAVEGAQRPGAAPEPAQRGPAGGNQLTAGERLRRGRAAPRAFEAEAKELGVDPEDLHGRARQIKSVDAAAVEEHNAFLREARSWLGSKGRRLADDPANVKGLDEAADAMARRHPGFFQGDEKSTDALYRLLRAGNQKPMSEADAYQQALTHLADLKAHAAATPEELADVNRRLEADGQPRATQADIGGLQEAAHRAAVAAPGGAAGEGPVGSAPAETDFDFGANEPGQRVAGTSPTRVPQPDPLADLARDFAAEESGAQPLHMIPAYQRAYDLVKRAVVYTGQAMARLSGKMFPAATALDREVGERMGNAAGAQAYVEHAKEYYRGKVFGDRAGDAEFRKLVGATDLELRFRYSMQARRNESAKASYAAHLARQQGDTAKAAEMAKRASDLLNKANATSTLVGGQNSPFKTEAEFQAARADPEVRAAMDRYEKYFVPRKEKNYRMSQGLDEADPIDSLTQRPGKDGRPGGHPLLALALTPDEVPGPGTVYADTAGRQGQGDRLSNLRLRRNPSSLEASLSAGAYETDLGEIMDRDLSRSYPIAVRAEAARLAVEKGVAKWGTDADRFAGFDKVPFTKPPRGTQENAPKQDTLFVRSEMAEEWTNAMHVGTPEAWKQWLAAANTVPNIAALSSSVEMAGHSVNQLRALFTKPSGAWDGGFSDFMGNLLKRFAPRWLGGNKAEFAEKLMRVAEVDALKPKGPETGTIFGALQGATKYLTGKDVPSGLKYADPTYYMGRVLDYLSDVTRATLGDWYDRQARQGKTEYSPAGKRDFINTSTGNYIRSSQNGVVRFLRDTGIGPFATAATTGITDTIRSLFLGTGLKATGLKAAVQMRAEVFAKMAAVVGATAVWNLAKWGRADGDDSTPFMALKVGIENGKTKSLDLTPLVGVKRGLRNLGVLGYIEAQRQGKTEGESEDKGLMQIVHSLAHPFMGPGPTFAKEAVLGTDAIGRRIAPTVSTATTAKGFNAAARMGKPLPGDPQWRENVKAAFKNANPAVAALTGADEPTKDVPVNERLAKLLGPYGFKYRDAAERKRKGLR